MPECLFKPLRILSAGHNSSPLSQHSNFNYVRRISEFAPYFFSRNGDEKVNIPDVRFLSSMFLDPFGCTPLISP